MTWRSRDQVRWESRKRLTYLPITFLRRSRILLKCGRLSWSSSQHCFISVCSSGLHAFSGTCGRNGGSSWAATRRMMSTRTEWKLWDLVNRGPNRPCVYTAYFSPPHQTVGSRKEGGWKEGGWRREAGGGRLEEGCWRREGGWGWWGSPAYLPPPHQTLGSRKEGGWKGIRREAGGGREGRRRGWASPAYLPPPRRTCSRAAPWAPPPAGWCRTRRRRPSGSRACWCGRQWCAPERTTALHRCVPLKSQGEIPQRSLGLSRIYLNLFHRFSTDYSQLSRKRTPSGIEKVSVCGTVRLREFFP